MLMKHAISRRPFIRFLAYSLTLLLLTGCRPPETGPSVRRSALEGARIVFIGPSRDDPQWPGIVGGAGRYLSNYPMLNVEYQSPPDNRAESYLSTVRTIASQQPRLIVLVHREKHVLGQAARTVIEAHVSVVTVGDRTDVLGVFAHVQEDTAGACDLLGRNLSIIAGDWKSYLLVHCRGSGRSGAYHYERYMSKARDFRGIALLREIDACEQSAQTVNPVDSIQAAIEMFPNVGFIVLLDAVVWQPGVLESLLQRKTRIVMCGTAPPLWPYLKSGDALALAGVNDGELGSAAAELAVAALTESRKPGTYKVVDSVLVTAATLPDFMQSYTAASGLQPEDADVKSEPGTSGPEQDQP